MVSNLDIIKKIVELLQAGEDPLKSKELRKLARQADVLDDLDEYVEIVVSSLEECRTEKIAARKAEEERARKDKFSRLYPVQIDLADFALADSGLPKSDEHSAWNEAVEGGNHILHFKSNAPFLDWSGAVSLPKKGTLGDLLDVALGWFYAKLKEPNECSLTPFGAASFTLAQLKWCGVRERWEFELKANPDAFARRIEQAHPQRSIDRVRKLPLERALVKAEPMKELDCVWLAIRESRQGIKSGFKKDRWLRSIYETKQDALKEWGEEQEMKIMPYPSAKCPRLDWPVDSHFSESTGQFLLQNTLERMPEFAAKVRRLATPVVFCHFPYGEFTEHPDPFSSLLSDIYGPAPVPAGQGWPHCRHCGTSLLFAQSLDFRDSNFVHLLPGVTVSVFNCLQCFYDDHYNCIAHVEWLKPEEGVVFVSAKSDIASKICEARPVAGIEYDDESLDEPTRLQMQQFESLCWERGLPWQSNARELKAGGALSFLQCEEAFYDNEGHKMEYIGMCWIAEHEDLGYEGFCYLFHSPVTGETIGLLQGT